MSDYKIHVPELARQIKEAGLTRDTSEVTPSTWRVRLYHDEGPVVFDAKGRTSDQLATDMDEANLMWDAILTDGNS